MVLAVISDGTSKPPPKPINGVEGKKRLKLLGVTLENNVCRWDQHVDDLLRTPEVECIF